MNTDRELTEHLTDETLEHVVGGSSGQHIQNAIIEDVGGGGGGGGGNAGPAISAWNTLLGKYGYT